MSTLDPRVIENFCVINDDISFKCSKLDALLIVYSIIYELVFSCYTENLYLNAVFVYICS